MSEQPSVEDLVSAFRAGLELGRAQGPGVPIDSAQADRVFELWEIERRLVHMIDERIRGDV